MTDLNAMVLYAKVVEQGGFTRAARALGLQTSLVSRAIAGLETDLGVRLLNRTTRRMSVTDVGRTFYEHCAALAAEAEAARAAIEQVRTTPRGLVRVSCPPSLLAVGVDRIMADFVHDWPQVRLDLLATGRRINLVEEGIDVALRVRALPLEDSGDAVRPLARSMLRLVAHRRLLQGRSMPDHPDDLQGLPTVDMSATLERHVWTMAHPDGRQAEFAHQPRLVTDDFGTLRLAALDGTGIAQLPGYAIEPDIDEGRLVPLLPAWFMRESLVHAVFPSRRGSVPAVRLLLDALVKAFEQGRIRS